MKSNLSRAGKQRFWEERVTEWSKTGISQAEYCRLNKIKLKSFQYWMRKTRRSSAPVLVELPLFKSPVPLLPHTPQLWVVIERYRIEIGKGFDSEDLERVVRVLGRI